MTSGTVRTTQMALEVLTVGGSGGTMTAYLQFLVSGSSVVNVIGLAPLAVSAEWVVSGGLAPHTYGWTLQDATNESGFASTAATSAITRTYSYTGGTRGIRRASATVSGASAQSVTSAYQLHVRAVNTPNAFDGVVQIENQAKRRVWPT